MLFYKEKDGHITREYELEEENPYFRLQTERALVEMVNTKEFGKTLFIDNELQLSEVDEYIYHEMLVHPCLSLANATASICIIGGGDGCAAREILKWRETRHLNAINIIDWDEELTDLFKDNFSDMNNGSLKDSIVSIENENIAGEFEWEDVRDYDVMIIDLLDPNFSEYGQRTLWESVFYATKKWINPHGSIVINAGGVTPWNMKHVNELLNMIQDSFGDRLNIHLYKVFVPSFGREWCFILMNQQISLDLYILPSSLRYCSKQTWEQAYRYGWSDEYLNSLDLNIERQLPSEEND